MMQTTPTLHSTTHPTPVGILTLVASDRGLRAVLWPKVSPQRAGISPRPQRNPDHPILRTTVQQLTEYFAGSRTGFDLPLDLEGTRFQLAAWRSLADIPFGATTTYGRQAAALGVPLRAVTTDVGVDVLSLGGTKNGLVYGEGIVVINPNAVAGVDFLRKAGFRKILNLKGGILAWSDEVDPSVPKY